jgi:hypothetical protein
LNWAGYTSPSGRKSGQSPQGRASKEIHHRFLVLETHLLLFGMHIYVHNLGIDIQIEEEEGVLAAAEEAGVKT